MLIKLGNKNIYDRTNNKIVPIHLPNEEIDVKTMEISPITSNVYYVFVSKYDRTKNEMNTKQTIGIYDGNTLKLDPNIYNSDGSIFYGKTKKGNALVVFKYADTDDCEFLLYKNNGEVVDLIESNDLPSRLADVYKLLSGKSNLLTINYDDNVMLYEYNDGIIKPYKIDGVDNSNITDVAIGADDNGNDRISIEYLDPDTGEYYDRIFIRDKENNVKEIPINVENKSSIVLSAKTGFLNGKSNFIGAEDPNGFGVILYYNGHSIEQLSGKLDGRLNRFSGVFYGTNNIIATKEGNMYVYHNGEIQQLQMPNDLNLEDYTSSNIDDFISGKSNILFYQTGATKKVYFVDGHEFKTFFEGGINDTITIAKKVKLFILKSGSIKKFYDISGNKPLDYEEQAVKEIIERTGMDIRNIQGLWLDTVSDSFNHDKVGNMRIIGTIYNEKNKDNNMYIFKIMNSKMKLIGIIDGKYQPLFGKPHDAMFWGGESNWGILTNNDDKTDVMLVRDVGDRLISLNLNGNMTIQTYGDNLSCVYDADTNKYRFYTVVDNKIVQIGQDFDLGERFENRILNHGMMSDPNSDLIYLSDRTGRKITKIFRYDKNRNKFVQIYTSDSENNIISKALAPSQNSGIYEFPKNVMELSMLSINGIC